MGYGWLYPEPDQDFHSEYESVALGIKKKEPPRKGGFWLMTLPVIGYFAWKFSDAKTRAAVSRDLCLPNLKGRVKKKTAKSSKSWSRWWIILGVIAFLAGVAAVWWFYFRTPKPEMPFDIEAQHNHLAPPGMQDHPLSRHRRMSQRSRSRSRSRSRRKSRSRRSSRSRR